MEGKSKTKKEKEAKYLHLGASPNLRSRGTNRVGRGVLTSMGRKGRPRDTKKTMKEIGYPNAGEANGWKLKKNRSKMGKRRTCDVVVKKNQETSVRGERGEGGVSKHGRGTKKEVEDQTVEQKRMLARGDPRA